MPKCYITNEECTCNEFDDCPHDPVFHDDVWEYPLGMDYTESIQEELQPQLRSMQMEAVLYEDHIWGE